MSSYQPIFHIFIDVSLIKDVADMPMIIFNKKKA